MQYGIGCETGVGLRGQWGETPAAGRPWPRRSRGSEGTRDVRKTLVGSVVRN